MKTLQVKDIWNNTWSRFQVIREWHHMKPCTYEKKILFDTDWYETLDEKESDKHYEKVENEKIRTIRPIQFEDGKLGIEIVLWND